MTATAAGTRTNAELVRQLFHTFFDERDFDAVRPYWTDQSVDYFLALGREARGATELEAFFRELFAAMPDWKLEVENVVDDGNDQVVVQWHATGTHTGAAWEGIEPTGRPVDIRGCDVIRVDDQKRVLTNTVYYDSAEFARQIGMLPPRDSPLDRGVLMAFNAATRARRRFAR